MLSEKPNYLIVTEKLGFKFPLAWCIAALVIGAATQEVSSALFISIGSLFMVWLTCKLASLFFSFQQHSGILKNNVYDNAIKAVWFISLICLLINVFKSIFFQQGSASFLGGVFSIVYFSFMLAAANKWGMHYVEKRV
jgi:hypothetical protein